MSKNTKAEYTLILLSYCQKQSIGENINLNECLIGFFSRNEYSFLQNKPINEKDLYHIACAFFRVLKVNSPKNIKSERYNAIELIFSHFGEKEYSFIERDIDCGYSFMCFFYNKVGAESARKNGYLEKLNDLYAAAVYYCGKIRKKLWNENVKHIN